jgi:hypothetical protein
MKTVKLNTLTCTNTTTTREIFSFAERDILGVVRDQQTNRAFIIAPIDPDSEPHELTPDFIRKIARGRKQIRDGRSIKHDDLKRKLGLR